jgi:hypothetical protein
MKLPMYMYLMCAYLMKLNLYLYYSIKSVVSASTPSRAYAVGVCDPTVH